MATKKGYTGQDLLLTKLKALYDIETQLVKALPKMAKAATDADLKAAFESHLRETEMHVERLENAFEFLDEKPDALACEAIRGLVEDAEWAVKEKPGDEALDALLIGAASRVEHYEMAGYITAVRWATIAGKEEIASLLAETLEEEQAADAKLADLAEGGIDERALAM